MNHQCNCHNNCGCSKHNYCRPNFCFNLPRINFGGFCCRRPCCNNWNNNCGCNQGGHNCGCDHNRPEPREFECKCECRECRERGFEQKQDYTYETFGQNNQNDCFDQNKNYNN